MRSRIVLLVSSILLGPLLLASGATAVTDFFLHGSGGTANPPTLFLDATAPAGSTAKYKDSTSVNFSGGNPWKEVGTWPTDPIPTSGTLVAVTPTTIWLGLKNSDDQGTNFDLLAELYKNGTLVSSGLNRCITGITRNPSQAKEVSVALSSPGSQSLNGSSDTLSLKVWTRIGTNPDDTKCAGHNNAVGLRLYFDATSRQSRVGLTITSNPIPTTLAPNPLTITVGATGTLTATIAPAPTADGTLAVSSANTGIATVPATVAFVSGQTSVPIPVTAVAVGNTQITASLNGGSASATVQVTPAPPTITSLLPPSLNLTQGATGTLTVTIRSAQPSDTVVTLSSTASGIASVPSSVTVPTGQITAPVPVTSNTPGTAQITASLNGTSASSMVTVTPAQATIVSLLPPTNPVTLGGTVTLTVTISATQPTDTVIAVSASPTGIVTVPASVTVPAGQLSAPIVVGTVALGTAMVHVSLNGSMAEATVQVTPPPPAVVSLTPSPLTVVVNATGQLTVTLNAAQSTNTPVTLTVDNPSVLQVPASVTVPMNQLSATFTVTGLAVGDALVTASVGSSSQTATVHVIPPPPVPVSLLPNPLPLQQGATGTLILTISATQVSDTVVPLTNSDATIIQVPSSVTVPAGQTTAAVPVTGLISGSATVSATLNGTTVSSTVQVTEPPPVVTSLTPATLSLPKGKPGVLRVTVSRAPTEPTPVTLTSSASGVATVPASVTIPAGALFADFPVMSISEGTATITASLNGGSATATVTVTPPEVVSLTLTPTNPSLYVGETQQFTATGTFTDGTTQNLTSTVTWTSGTETVATINAAGLATSLAVGTTTITASISTSMGPVTASTTLTVNPPPQMLLIPSTATLQVGENVSLTLDAGALEGTGGLTVTLAQNGTGTVIVPSSVVVPEGQQTVPVIVTGATAGSVTLTASATGRLSATAALTVTPGVPSITSFSPLTGPVGTTVTITGTSFHAVASENTVKFNGTLAIITSVNSTGTQIVTTVPQGATTGPITVTTAMGTGTSAQNFTVTLSADFQLSGAPAAITAVQGQSALAILQLTGPTGFANLVNLTISGLPTGVTASFSAPVISLNQPVTLALATGMTTPAGTTTITVTSTTTVDGQTVTRSAPVALTVLGAGDTTLAGRVLRAQDSAPLQGVTLRIGTQTTQSDASGRFLFVGAPAGNQLLTIDGSTVLNPPGLYPSVPAQVTIVANQANELPFVSYLPGVDTSVLSVITPGTTSVIQDARIPGFNLTIPAGVELRSDVDGSLISQVAVTPISPDHIPVPAPGPGFHIDPSTIFMLTFFDSAGNPKSGGATATQPIAQFAAPNDLGAKPGSGVIFYYYDSTPALDPTTANKWKLAGSGSISLDGLTATPNAGVDFPHSSFRFIFACNILTIFGNPSPPNASKGGDPVDLATGQFTLSKTDMVLPGRLPVVIQRGYLSGLSGFPGPFGLGSTLNLELEVTRFGNSYAYTQADGRVDLLILQTDGTFRQSNLPHVQGIVLTENAGGTKTLRKKDGAIERYNSAGRLTAIEDRNGNTITIERTGNLINRILNASGRALTVSYDGAERITSITDPLGRVVRYAYNNGQLETVTDPAGGVTRYGYTSALSTITDARGIIYLQNEYDAQTSRVTKQTLADSGVWTFAYGTFGDTITQTTVTDPRGNRTTYRFTPAKFAGETTDRLGQRTRNEYDPNFGWLLSTTDPLGRKTSFTYDSLGNVTSITDPDNKVTQFEYEPTFSRVTMITDALNQVTEFTYDPANGNLLTTKDSLNHVTTITYNSFGQPTSVQGPIPSEPPTTFAYDADGNLITTTDPLGNATQRAYDAVSRLVSLTDPRGLSTQFNYDALNRVSTIADSSHGLTRFLYDPNGNLLEVRDAKGQATTYTYDNMDRLATRKDALNRQETYQYDPAGNLSQFTDRKNQQSTFTYDSLNRRTGTSYQDGSSTSFVYDSVGRLAKATDSLVGAIEFVYDNLDRLSKEISAQGVVEYTYDALGRRTTMKANGATLVSYGYDAASRLIQVAQAGLVVGLGYDNSNRRTSLTYPNGTSTSYSYDNASRLMSIAHNGPSGLIENLSYVYDAAGNRISLTRTNGMASNLPAAVQAAYDVANEQVAFNSLPATFDANGNQATSTDASGTTTYTWDARNRLTTINSPGLSGSFSYDALGRRISKTINGVTTSYIYDGNDIVQEIGGSAVGASYVRSLSVDEPFVRQTASGNEFYHADALGSSLALSNTAGATAVSYTYEAFGKTTISGSSTNPFQYTGRENDGTGLIHYRARQYSPQLHRFMSEDPILAPFTPLSVGMCRMINWTVWFLPRKLRTAQSVPMEEINSYLYAKDNPIAFKDPLGLCSYQQQITKCYTSSELSYDQRETVLPSGDTVNTCLGTRLVGIGRQNRMGGTKCKEGYPPDEQCLIEDVLDANGRCSGGPPLPSACGTQMIDCIKNDPTVRR